MTRPERILVHACCASCSSYVLGHLQESYEVSAFFYNPNIQPEEEYLLRLGEMSGVCGRLGIGMAEGPRDFERWNAAAAPWSHLPEGGIRCRVCYRIRLEETAARAAEQGFALFTTTLSVSPHKIHPWIVEEGRKAGSAHGVRFLEEDFKKKGGFQESCRISREYGLTRQDYCGCLYSLREAAERRGEKP